MLQAVLAEKRGLQQPLRGNAQKKGAAKGKTLAVPVSKALRGGQGAGRRGRGGRGGSTGGRGQQGEKFWNPASLKITIKNDKVSSPHHEYLSLGLLRLRPGSTGLKLVSSYYLPEAICMSLLMRRSRTPLRILALC